LSRDTWIYGLFASDRPDEIRYIGVSVDPVARLKNHVRSINYASEKNPHKVRWIKSALSRGATIESHRLAQFFSEHDAYASEDDFIIEYVRRGHKLTNKSKGGRGGVLVPDAELDEFYIRRAESTRSESTRSKMSAKARESFQRPGRYELHVEMVRANAASAEFRSLISDGLANSEKALLARENANATRRTEENRDAARARAAEQFSTEESKESARSHAKSGWANATPEQRSARILKTKLGIDLRKAKKNGWVLDLTPTVHICKEPV
jgi:hypothetical protein